MYLRHPQGCQSLTTSRPENVAKDNRSSDRWSFELKNDVGQQRHDHVS